MNTGNQQPENPQWSVPPEHTAAHNNRKKVEAFLAGDDNVTGVVIGESGILVLLTYSDEGGIQALSEIEGVPVEFIVTGSKEKLL